MLGLTGCPYLVEFQATGTRSCSCLRILQKCLSTTSTKKHVLQVVFAMLEKANFTRFGRRCFLIFLWAHQALTYALHVSKIIWQYNNSTARSSLLSSRLQSHISPDQTASSNSSEVWICSHNGTHDRAVLQTGATWWREPGCNAPHCMGRSCRGKLSIQRHRLVRYVFVC